MITINHGLAEGQVLQRLGARGATVSISGAGAPAGALTVSISGGKGGKKTLRGWHNQKAGSVSASGAFKIKLAGIPAGGPYRLTLTAGGESLMVKEFYVGDVWVLAGQSNMEGCGRKIPRPAKHPLVRAFSLRREWRQAVDPLHILGESPDRCHHVARQLSREEAERQRHDKPNGTGSGVGFAIEMLKHSGVPQGLICVAHGGTSMSQWEPGQVIDGEPQMYASALASLRATGQPVSGVLWYQGESDTDRDDAVAQYTARMKTLVAALRRDLRQPALPWLVVQIARVYGANDPRRWNAIQEQQRRLPKVIKNLSVISAIDLTLDDGIHLSAEGQQILAGRFAREARRLVFGAKELPPPSLKKIGRREKTPMGHYSIDVEYDNVVGGLSASGEPLGFRVVNQEGADTGAAYKVEPRGNVARLYCNPGAVLADARVCYGYGTAPVCNLTDGRGYALPVMGPQDIGSDRPSRPRAWLPFITKWLVTAPQPAPLPLNEIAEPDVAALGGVAREYQALNPGFVNEHPNWEGKSGQAYFAAALSVPEPMTVKLLLGYDGPCRLWLGGREVWCDMLGLNPALADAHEVTLKLSPGRHRLTLGMDLNRGAAWGFFLRGLRLDVSSKQLSANTWARIGYEV